jgi:hypothetical protein
MVIQCYGHELGMYGSVSQGIDQKVDKGDVVKTCLIPERIKID